MDDPTLVSSDRNPTRIRTNGPSVETLVFLLGRPPLTEYLDYVSRQTLCGNTVDLRALTEEWRKAHDSIIDLALQEPNMVQCPAIAPLPPHLLALRDEVMADPVFQYAFRLQPADVGMVELDRLVVYQKHINLGHIQRLKGELASPPSDEDIFRFCLALDHPSPVIRWTRTDDNTYVFVSPSNDLRFLESTVLEPDQVSRYAPRKSISGVVGLVVGFGSNFFHALHVENRLVLNNGYHRAFALRDLGITHAPCIVQHVYGRQELQAVSSSDLKRNPDLYLKHPRPSLLKDYFDPRLRKMLDVPQRLRQVRVRFEIDTAEIPAI